VSATTNATTQYNIEALQIKNRVTSEKYNIEDIPIENFEGIGKKVMTVLLQFYTKFGSVKLNNNNGKRIAESMMERDS